MTILNCPSPASTGRVFRYLKVSMIAAVFHGLSLADSVLLNEGFQNLDAWTDLSKLVSWGGYGPGTSCFSLGKHDGRQAVQMKASAMAHAGYALETDIKTFTALDFVFPVPVQHRNNDLRITLDLAFEAANQGEAGRFMIVLMDDYPAEGLAGENYNNPQGHPYGTPAVHVRIIPGEQTLLQYGGGHEGEFEKYSQEGQFKWWLPGFIQNAEGTGHGSPGQGNEWPNGSWKRLPDLTNTTWKTFRYEVTKSEQTFYDGNQKLGTMPLPYESSTAPKYEYYEEFKALRLFWRGKKNVYVANLKVEVLGTFTVGLLDEHTDTDFSLPASPRFGFRYGKQGIDAAGRQLDSMAK